MEIRCECISCGNIVIVDLGTGVGANENIPCPDCGNLETAIGWWYARASRKWMDKYREQQS